MKRTLGLIGVFLVGIAVGIGGMLVVVKKGPTEILETQIWGSVYDRVIYATLLHDQRYADLEKVLENGMFASLNFMKGLGFNDRLPSSEGVVRGYYDLSGSPVPDRLAPYLSGVKGNADVRRLADLAVKNAE